MKYLLLSFTLVLFACHSSNEAVQNKEEKTMIPDSIPAKQEGKTRIAETGTNCNRGTAEPIVRKGTFSNSTFELQPDKLTGVETINQDNGDKIRIRNWGCDYYALTFRFETDRFKGEPSNVGFWYKRTVTLLNELNKNLDAPVDIVKGTERLITAIEDNVPTGYENMKYNEEFDFGEEAPRNFVSIDKVEQLDNGKFAIEVTFAKGPL